MNCTGCTRVFSNKQVLKNSDQPLCYILRRSFGHIDRFHAWSYGEVSQLQHNAWSTKYLEKQMCT
jgi:hypothetical protein